MALESGAAQEARLASALNLSSANPEQLPEYFNVIPRERA